MRMLFIKNCVYYDECYVSVNVCICEGVTRCYKVLNHITYSVECDEWLNS